MGLKYISLFSGIGGFELGIHAVFPDAECVGYCEINAQARNVYASHFPQHPLLCDDVTKLIWTPHLHSLHPTIDLLVGGFPCQDLSNMSYMRKDKKQRRIGLGGAKSGLFYELVRLIREIKPRFFVVENVASSTKKQQAQISSALGVQPVLVDAALFGPQRRKRLFWANFVINPPQTRLIDAPCLFDVLDEIDVAATYELTAWGKWFMSQHYRGKPRYLTEATTSSDVCAKPLTSSSGLPRGMMIDDRFVPPMPRRFTVREMEQLQTFPVGWVGNLGQTAAKKLLGNAVCVRVVEYVIRQLLVK